MKITKEIPLIKGAYVELPNLPVTNKQQLVLDKIDHLRQITSRGGNNISDCIFGGWGAEDAILAITKSEREKIGFEVTHIIADYESEGRDYAGQNCMKATREFMGTNPIQEFVTHKLYDGGEDVQFDLYRIPAQASAQCLALLEAGHQFITNLSMEQLRELQKEFMATGGDPNTQLSAKFRLGNSKTLKPAGRIQPLDDALKAELAARRPVSIS